MFEKAFTAASMSSSSSSSSSSSTIVEDSLAALKNVYMRQYQWLLFIERQMFFQMDVSVNKSKTAYVNAIIDRMDACQLVWLTLSSKVPDVCTIVQIINADANCLFRTGDVRDCFDHVLFTASVWYVTSSPPATKQPNGGEQFKIYDSDDDHYMSLLITKKSERVVLFTKSHDGKYPLKQLQNLTTMSCCLNLPGDFKFSVCIPSESTTIKVNFEGVTHTPFLIGLQALHWKSYKRYESFVYAETRWARTQLTNIKYSSDKKVDITAFMTIDKVGTYIPVSGTIINWNNDLSKITSELFYTNFVLKDEHKKPDSDKGLQNNRDAYDLKIFHKEISYNSMSFSSREVEKSKRGGGTTAGLLVHSRVVYVKCTDHNQNQILQPDIRKVFFRGENENAIIPDIDDRILSIMLSGGGEISEDDIISLNYSMGAMMRDKILFGDVRELGGNPLFVHFANDKNNPKIPDPFSMIMPGKRGGSDDPVRTFSGCMFYSIMKDGSRKYLEFFPHLKSLPEKHLNGEYSRVNDETEMLTDISWSGFKEYSESEATGVIFRFSPKSTTGSYKETRIGLGEASLFSSLNMINSFKVKNKSVVQRSLERGKDAILDIYTKIVDVYNDPETYKE